MPVCQRFGNSDIKIKYQRIGDTVIELAVHIGYLLLIFAQSVGGEGRVTVFKPSTNNLPFPRKKLAANSNITLVEDGYDLITPEGILVYYNETGRLFNILALSGTKKAWS